MNLNFAGRNKNCTRSQGNPGTIETTCSRGNNWGILDRKAKTSKPASHRQFTWSGAGTRSIRARQE
ncbi:hypothetical protein E2C01_073985 [Portunus trituberculatus]|uniref:Uncharacterized protein n=1 Tax=Portunus trituberculatus TaxID=210409 RepID=A0A5B7ID48_PORTR|nr:hypothetical protein [Portunus trituberculatus]